MPDSTPLYRARADLLDHLEIDGLTADGLTEEQDRILFHLSDGGCADSTCLVFGIDRDTLVQIAAAANEPELVALASA